MIRRAHLLALGSLVLVCAGAVWALAGNDGQGSTARARVDPLPTSLAGTGLYADDSLTAVAPGALPYTPQYPLWSDGAQKRRWVALPAGATIDGSNPDAWRFPVGTRFWKEFAFGRRVETRYLERLGDGTWRFAAYRWSADGREAVLAPEHGVHAAHTIRAGLTHDIPSRQDCLACHGGRAEPVLGFTALQLSPDRDPLAPHAETPEAGALDLAGLTARGLLVRTPSEAAAPRIPARNGRERAALGYLHANCGSCHATGGPLQDLGLALDVRFADGQEPAALRTALGREGRYRLPGAADERLRRLHAGRPDASLVFRRAASRQPALQMPPLGSKARDDEALALLEAWIRDDLAAQASPPHPSQE